MITLALFAAFPAHAAREFYGTFGSAGFYAPASYARGPVYYPMAYVPAYVLPPPPPPIYIDAAYGSYCREYSRTVHRDGQVRESYGTACLQPDGSWKAVHH